MTNTTNPELIARLMIADFDATTIRASIDAHEGDYDLIYAMIDDAPEDEDLNDAVNDDALLNATLRDPLLPRAIRAEIARRFSI